MKNKPHATKPALSCFTVAENLKETHTDPTLKTEMKFVCVCVLDLLQGVRDLDSFSLHRWFSQASLAHPRQVSVAGHVV